MLFALFKQVKKVYTSSPLLVVQDIAPGLWLEDEKCPYILRNQEDLVLTAIRKTNIVTYLLTIMGRLQYGFSFLDDNFIEIFCPVTTDLPFEAERALTTSLGRLLKPQAVLYLNLKTHAFISAMEPFRNNATEFSSARERILNCIFAPDMEEYLLAKRRLRSAKLSPSEEDFVKRCAHRREKLLAQESLNLLMAEYDWLEFFKEIFFYIQRNVGVLVWGKRGNDLTTSFIDTGGLGDSAGLEAETPDQTSLQAGTSRLSSEPLTDASGDVTAQGQSKRPSPAPFKEAPPTKKLKQKRLWTKQEEGALVEALKAHGPAWSKILELHGAGGSISESLKNRTQVQLKDKARNWKMYFLKGGLPVPEYLCKVTGDLERDEKSKQRFKSRVKRPSTPSPKPSKVDDYSNGLRDVANLSAVAQATLRTSPKAVEGTEMDPELRSA